MSIITERKQVKGDREWSKGGFQLTFEVITRVKVEEEEMIYRKRSQWGHETLLGLGREPLHRIW